MRNLEDVARSRLDELIRAAALDQLLETCTIVASLCDCDVRYTIVPNEAIEEFDHVPCPWCGSNDTMPVLEALTLAR